MNHIYNFICNHQLFTNIDNSNFFLAIIFLYIGLGIHFLIMIINLIPYRLSTYDNIEKKDIYVIASIIYIFLQTIVSYIICLFFLFFGWVGLALMVIYFFLYVIIAKVKDENDDTVFVFGLGEYPIYLSDKSHYYKNLSDNYKKFKEKNKGIV
jgi:hypothetical protein